MPVPVIVYALLLVFEALLPLEQSIDRYLQDQAAPVSTEVLVLRDGQIAERYYLTAEGRRQGFAGDLDSNRLFAFETLQRSAHMYVVYPMPLDEGPKIFDLGPVLEQFRDPRAVSRQVLRGALHPEAGELGTIGIERIGSEYYVELHEHGKVLVVRPAAMQ
ncbi:MAG: hypothetical protein EA428_10890 [Spirochaetaceae bacterium]|nr:MAG: hypothetical protein EA428_10890 [Spirochaetaceae bacterium]